MFEEQENLLSTNRGNDFNHYEEPNEVDKVREENEKLRSRLQNQAYEIEALSSQLKLANTVEETKRFSQSTRDIRSSRGLKSGKDPSKYGSMRLQGIEKR